MDAQRAADWPAGDGPSGGPVPLILLAEAASEVERALVRRWLSGADLQPSAVLPLDGPRPGPVAGRHAAGHPGHRGAGGVAAARARRRAARRAGRASCRWSTRGGRRRSGRPASPAATRTGPGSWSPSPPPWPRCARGGAAPARSRTSSRGRPGWRWSGPSGALRGYKYKVPRHVVEAIQDSPGFRREVAALAGRLQLAEAEVLELRRGRAWTAWSRR